MFHALGTQYALMLTGEAQKRKHAILGVLDFLTIPPFSRAAFLTLAMVPFPFLFFKNGHKYRKGSKFANTE